MPCSAMRGPQGARIAGDQRREEERACRRTADRVARRSRPRRRRRRMGAHQRRVAKSPGTRSFRATRHHRDPNEGRPRALAVGDERVPGTIGIHHRELRARAIDIGERLEVLRTIRHRRTAPRPSRRSGSTRWCSDGNRSRSRATDGSRWPVGRTPSATVPSTPREPAPRTVASAHGEGVRELRWSTIPRSAGCASVARMRRNRYARVVFTIGIRRRSYVHRPEIPIARGDQVATSAESASVSRRTSLPKFGPAASMRRSNAVASLIVELRPFAVGHDSRHPDPMPTQLRRRQRPCGGQWVPWPDEKLERRVERVIIRTSRGNIAGSVTERKEASISPASTAATATRGSSTLRVTTSSSTSGASANTRAGQRPAPTSARGRRCAAPATRPHRGDCPSTPATMPRAWRGTPGRRASAGRPERAGEQSDAQLALESRDPLRDGLLSHPQFVRRMP